MNKFNIFYATRNKGNFSKFKDNFLNLENVGCVPTAEKADLVLIDFEKNLRTWGVPMEILNYTLKNRVKTIMIFEGAESTIIENILNSSPHYISLERSLDSAISLVKDKYIGYDLDENNEYLNDKVPFVFKGLQGQEAPQKQSKEAAGIDLFSVLDENIEIEPGQTKVIQTGFSVAIPKGYVGLLFARSSLGFKFQCTLTNGVGVIDSDYRGGIGVSITNIGNKSKTIEPGERVAQLVLLKLAEFDYIPVESLNETERGTGGFGSTGKI